MAMNNDLLDIFSGPNNSIEQIRSLTKKLGEKKRNNIRDNGGCVADKVVSIIIPLTGTESEINTLLTSLEKNILYKNCEVILVFDENWNSKNRILEESRFNYVGMNIPSQYSIGARCEFAANLSEGNNIIFINPNIEIRLNWLEYLLKLFVSKNAVALTSKVLRTIDKIEEAGYSFIEDNIFVGNGRGEFCLDSAFNFSIQVPTASRYCLFIKRQIWDEIHFDENIENYELALYDLGMQINDKGYKIFYQPLSVLQLQLPETIIPFDNDTLQPHKDILFQLQPKTRTINLTGDTSEKYKTKILILGIYLGEQPNNIEHIAETIENTLLCEVKQKWVAINRRSSHQLLQKYTVGQIDNFIPKFEILNNLLRDENISDYDYIIAMDDDVILPDNFIDSFISVQIECDYALAQPARTKNSYIDHPIVQQQDGVVARTTRFVEIGPIFSVRKDIYEIIFPFNLTSPMGWGYENIWAKRLSDYDKKMGIIDAVPVDHSLRKPVVNYNWSIADEQRTKILEDNPHFELENCFSVIEVKN